MGCQDNGQKTKVVALYCSFQNLFEVCPTALLLWRYEFEKNFTPPFFFCIFLHENNVKQYDFNAFGKLREGAIIIASWEI